MKRPEFDSIIDFDEFSRYYWYRDELTKICKLHGLKCNGSKIELNAVIKAYFSGEKILPEKKPSCKRTILLPNSIIIQDLLHVDLHLVIDSGISLQNRQE